MPRDPSESDTPPKWTEQKVIKLSDAIFTLGVYRSDLADVFQQMLDRFQNDLFTFYAWGYGAVATPTEVLSEGVMAQLVIRLLGYGIRGLDKPFPSDFYWRPGLGTDFPIERIELPLQPSGMDRYIGQALSQDSKRKYRKRGGLARVNLRTGPDEPRIESRTRSEAEAKDPSEVI